MTTTLFLKTTLKWHISPSIERFSRFYLTYAYILWNVFKRLSIKYIISALYITSRIKFEMTTKLFLKATLKWHISPSIERFSRFYLTYAYILWNVFKRISIKYIHFCIMYYQSHKIWDDNDIILQNNLKMTQ
jgi:hypothetical protein